MTRLPEPDLGRALSEGTLGPESRRRDVVHLQETLRQRMVNEALATAQRIEDEEDRAFLLADIGGTLPH